MENSDINTVDSRILGLSEQFQKALTKASTPFVLLGIKRELSYWREQRKILLSENTHRRIS